MRKNNMKKPEEKEIIVKRYFCGESVAKLASEYEIGLRQIYHWINKYQENLIQVNVLNLMNIWDCILESPKIN